MDKLCKFCWEKTPALCWEYRTRTTLQKSARDKTPMGGTMCKEGSITLPLCIIGAAVLLTVVPCMCLRKMRKKKKAPKQANTAC